MHLILLAIPLLLSLRRGGGGGGGGDVVRWLCSSERLEGTC